jgi:hypothetical protein
MVIVVGLAIVERECWVVSGFEPQDEGELSRLETERKRLGFDPRLRNHELTACKNDQAVHRPKRVLGELTGYNRDRQRRCWKEVSLNLLQERGGQNGLATYLHEVRDLLAPLTSNRDGRPG